MPISADRILAVKLVSDVSSIAGDMKKTERGVKRLGTKMRGLGRSAASWGKAFAGAAVLSGIEAIGGMIGDAVEGAQEGERQLASLRDTAERLGLPFDKLAKGMEAVGDAALRAGVDDTPLQRMFNALIAKGDPAWRATRKVNAALDVSAKMGIPVEAAGKLVQKAMDGNAQALRKLGLPASAKGTEALRLIEERFGGAAEAAGNADPMRKALNEIGEAMEKIAGIVVVPILKALGDVMRDTVAPGITAISDALAGVDWGSIDWGQALKDVLSTALNSVATAVFTGELDGPATLGAAIAAVIFGVAIFTKAATTMFGLPAWAARSVVAVAAKALGLSMAAGMWAVQVFVGFAVRALAAIGISTKALSAAYTTGTAIGARVLAGIATGLTGVALVRAVADTLWNRFKPNVGGIDSPNPANGRQLPKDPLRELFRFFGINYGLGTGGASPGWHIVGERGAELVRFRGGEEVLSHRASMGAVGGGGNINVSITTGVGDPISIGREVDRVLRQYRRRAGLPV